jgi:hypothetical protein
LSASLWTWVRIITHSKDASLYIRNKYDEKHPIFWNGQWSAMLNSCTTRKNIVQKQHALMCLGQNTEILKSYVTSELFICLYLQTPSSYIGTYRLQMITQREFWM